MDRDFIYRQTLVWLEHENVPHFAPHWNNKVVLIRRKELAESLASHLFNNWLQVQKATTAKRMGDLIKKDFNPQA